MTKKGLSKYQKALSLTKDKWDLKKNEPKESGTAIDDVVDCVRLKMHERYAETVDVDNDDNDEVFNSSKQERKK